MIVHCRTQEQWDFINKKHENRFSSRTWYDFKEKTYFRYDSYGDYGFSSINHCKNLGFKKPISFEQWLKEAGHEKEWYSEFLKNKKIWIGDNPELCEKVQERLFKFGWHWTLTGTNVKIFPDMYYLLIDDNFCLSFGGYKDRYNSYPSKEIALQDLGIEENDLKAKKIIHRYNKGDIMQCCEDKPKFKVGDEVYLISKDKARNLFYGTKYKISHVSLGSEWIRLENPPDNSGIFYPMDHFDFWHNHPSQIKRKAILMDEIGHVESKTFGKMKEASRITTWADVPARRFPETGQPQPIPEGRFIYGCDPYKKDMEGGGATPEEAELYWKHFGNEKEINLVRKNRIVKF